MQVHRFSENICCSTKYVVGSGFGTGFCWIWVRVLCHENEIVGVILLENLILLSSIYRCLIAFDVKMLRRPYYGLSTQFVGFKISTSYWSFVF